MCSWKLWEKLKLKTQVKTFFAQPLLLLVDFSMCEKMMVVPSKIKVHPGGKMQKSLVLIGVIFLIILRFWVDGEIFRVAGTQNVFYKKLLWSRPKWDRSGEVEIDEMMQEWWMRRRNGGEDIFMSCDLESKVTSTHEYITQVQIHSRRFIHSHIYRPTLT